MKKKFFYVIFVCIKVTWIKGLCTIRVSEQKSEVAISEMFTMELKFSTDSPIKLFNRKIKSKY